MKSIDTIVNNRIAAILWLLDDNKIQLCISIDDKPLKTYHSDDYSIEAIAKLFEKLKKEINHEIPIM